MSVEVALHHRDYQKFVEVPAADDQLIDVEGIDWVADGEHVQGRVDVIEPWEEHDHGPFRRWPLYVPVDPDLRDPARSDGSA